MQISLSLQKKEREDWTAYIYTHTSSHNVLLSAGTTDFIIQPGDPTTGEECVWQRGEWMNNMLWM